MNNIKEQLKNVLEDEKRFTNQTEQMILHKIEQKQKPIKPWTIRFSVVAFIIASVFFAALMIEQKSEQITLPPEDMAGLEEQLLATFHLDMANTSYEVLYSKVGFESSDDAIVVFQKGIDLMETVIYKWQDDQWVRSLSGSLNTENDRNWSIAGTGPYLITGVLSASNVNRIIIGEKEVDFVNIPNYVYYAATVEERVNRVVAQYIDNRYERLLPKYVVPIGEINVVVPAGNQVVVPYKEETMTLKNNEYVEFPIVVDRSFETLQRGDVVYVDDHIHTPFVTRIITLPGESMAIQNSTVLINDKPLEHPIGYTKIDGEYVLEGYLKNGKSVNQAEAERIFNLKEGPFRLSDQQYAMIGDNWKESDLSLIDPKYIVGKVIGYNRSDVAKVWSEEERALYEKFHQTHDLELLRNVTPTQIVRMYFYASFMNHFETSYQFYSTRSDSQKWSLQEHIYYSKLDRERYGDISIHYVELAKLIQDGTFIQTDEYRGYIEYDQKMQRYELIKNDDGIWQVDF